MQSVYRRVLYYIQWTRNNGYHTASNSEPVIAVNIHLIILYLTIHLVPTENKQQKVAKWGLKWRKCDKVQKPKTWAMKTSAQIFVYTILNPTTHEM
jgi:hypothetical protein